MVKIKTIRLSDEDNRMLEELAKKYNMTSSDLIRHLIRNEYEKLMQFYAELSAEFYSE
jgi:predicted DNA-binding protein